MKKLVISLLLPLATGFLGSFSTMSSIEGWYARLNQPTLAPPNWVFGPVWTTLYLMMGYAFFLIWKSDYKKKSLALGVFLLQLVLNGIWTPIFFGAENLALALGVIIALDIAVIATIILFYKIKKPAAYLLLPYLAWTLFASYLNYQFLMLN